MSRPFATFQPGPHFMDHMGASVLASVYPLSAVQKALSAAKRGTRRQRSLPAEVTVYFVMCLGLFAEASMREVLRCVLEGLRLAGRPGPGDMPVKSAITQARARVGARPLEVLRDRRVRPLAKRDTRGAWYNGLRLVGVDGTTLDVLDEKGNRETFGLPGAARGEAAFPQVRLTMLTELGTHASFAWRHGPVSESEVVQAEALLPRLSRGMLLLADRGYCGFPLWMRAREQGVELLWRAKRNLRLPVEEVYADGSYRSTLRGSGRDRNKSHGSCPVRVVEYTLPNQPNRVYRLVTSLMDPQAAPALELAALYRERWEIENTHGEIKTHMLKGRSVLRSRTPDLVRQEIDGLMLAHYAVRTLIHKSALREDIDPDRLSFTHAARVVRRSLGSSGVSPPQATGAKGRQ